MVKCDACKQEVYQIEACAECQAKICPQCEKSARRLSDSSRLMICKRCWSKADKRADFKGRT